MRFVRLLAALGFFVGAADASEVLVFVDGTRIEVRRYEVRGDLIVLETMEGQLRSVPRSYVDIQMSPSHRAPNRETAVPAGRLEKARRILELFGAGRHWERVWKRVEKDLAVLGERLPQPERHDLCVTFQERFDGTQFLGAVAMNFAAKAPDRFLDDWLDWLESPVARRVLETEQTAPNRRQAVETGSVSYRRLAVSSFRMGLIERLDETIMTSETCVEMLEAVERVLHESCGALSPEYAAGLDSGAVRGRWSAEVTETIQKDMFHSYQSVSDDDLWGYLTYWESQMGRRFTLLFREALLAAVQFAADSTRHIPTE